MMLNGLMGQLDSRSLYPTGIEPREPIYRGDVFYLAPTTIAPSVPTRTTATYPTLPAQLPTTSIIPIPPPPVYTPLPVYAPAPQLAARSSNLMLIAALAIGALLLLRGR